MNTMDRVARIVVWPLLIVVALMAFGTGCEKSDGDGTRFLTVSPPSVLMGTNLVWVTLTVVDGTRELSMPLRWTVENSQIGFIREPTAGFSALYVRTPNNGIRMASVSQ